MAWIRLVFHVSVSPVVCFDDLNRLEGREGVLGRCSTATSTDAKAMPSKAKLKNKSQKNMFRSVCQEA